MNHLPASETGVAELASSGGEQLAESSWLSWVRAVRHLRPVWRTPSRAEAGFRAGPSSTSQLPRTKPRHPLSSWDGFGGVDLPNARIPSLALGDHQVPPTPRRSFTRFRRDDAEDVTSTYILSAAGRCRMERIRTPRTGSPRGTGVVWGFLRSASS